MSKSNCTHIYQDIAGISVCSRCGSFDLGETTIDVDKKTLDEAIGHIFEAVSLLKKAGVVDSTKYKAGGILIEGDVTPTTWSLQVQEGVCEDG